MFRTFAVLGFALLGAVTSNVQQPSPSPAATVAPPAQAHFHHLHLNATDPSAAVNFYTGKFDCEKSRLNNADAVWAQKSWLLFNKVGRPPKSEITSTIWHFGWGAEDMKATYQKQVDSGTKMLHLGKNTVSRIISKGIAAGQSNNTYRGLVSAHRKAKGARNFTNCDSLLIGDKCGAHTVPYIEAKNSSATFEHEATTSKISEDMLFYCRQRGMSAEEATALVVNGFVKDVLQQLPMEFAVEAQKLISISLEGSVG